MADPRERRPIIWHKVSYFLQVSYFYFAILELIQNTTIEERVALLEVEVEQIQDDVTGLNVCLTEVDENVDFLFDEQVIQDERLLNLETETEGIENEIEG